MPLPAQPAFPQSGWKIQLTGGLVIQQKTGSAASTAVAIDTHRKWMAQLGIAQQLPGLDRAALQAKPALGSALVFPPPLLPHAPAGRVHPTPNNQRPTVAPVVQRAQSGDRPPVRERPRTVGDVTERLKQRVVPFPIYTGAMEAFSKRKQFIQELLSGKFQLFIPWPLLRYPAWYLLASREERRRDVWDATKKYAIWKAKQIPRSISAMPHALKEAGKLGYDVVRAELAPEEDYRKLWAAHDNMLHSYVRKMFATAVTGWFVSQTIKRTGPRLFPTRLYIPRMARGAWLFTGLFAFTAQARELYDRMNLLPRPFLTPFHANIDRRIAQKKKVLLDSLPTEPSDTGLQG
jgi:hypothetical protein